MKDNWSHASQNSMEKSQTQYLDRHIHQGKSTTAFRAVIANVTSTQTMDNSTGGNSSDRNSGRPATEVLCQSCGLWSDQGHVEIRV